MREPTVEYRVPDTLTGDLLIHIRLPAEWIVLHPNIQALDLAELLRSLASEIDRRRKDGGG